MKSDLPSSLQRGNMTLREVTSDDYPFLRALYRDVRQQELSVTGWPQQSIDAFCDSQFGLQDHHYRTYFPNARYYLIELEQKPIGRIYLNNDPESLWLMEISLISALRGRGLGTLLMQWLTDMADTSERPMLLHVEPNNPARHMYERSGFVAQELEGAYLKMERGPQPPH